jgi:hypothetical protein
MYVQQTAQLFLNCILLSSDLFVPDCVPPNKYDVYTHTNKLQQNFTPCFLWGPFTPKLLNSLLKNLCFHNTVLHL